MRKIETTVILALPASQYFRCKVAKSPGRPAKRPKINVGYPEHLGFQWDECEQLLHYRYINTSATAEPTSYQIPWLTPPSSVGLTREDFMTCEIERTSTCALEAKKENVSINTESSHPGSNGALSNCFSEPTVSPSVSQQIPQQMLPASKTTSRVLRLTKTLLGAVSNYLNTSNFGEKRHSPHETSGCCLCHTDGNGRRAIRTVEELKSYVHNDVVEMLQPIWSEISSLKTDLQSSWQQTGAVRNICGDVHVSKVEPTEESNDSRSRQLQVTTQPQYQPSSPSVVAVTRKRAILFDEHSTDLALVEQNERYAKMLKERAREIETLRATVHELINYQEYLAAELDRLLCTGRGSAFPDGRPTLYLDLLESTYKASLSSLDSFTSYFVAYSEAHLHVPANKIWKPNFQNMYLAKDTHWTYALKAFFCEKMFIGFESESFMTDSASLHLDPAELRKESYAYFQRMSCVESSASTLESDAHFKIFCQQKFDSILPEVILLQPRDFDPEDLEPLGTSFPTEVDINLSKSFTAAAMKVWALHKLCFSFDPPISIFRARRGVAVDWNYMDSVVTLDDDKHFIPKVGFMICPGFHLRRSIVKSQVYLGARASEHKSEVGMHIP